jgi:hypothetical protein
MTGFATTSLGLLVAFVPSRQIESVWVFEAKLLLGCALFWGIAALLFRVQAAARLASPGKSIDDSTGGR